MILSGIFMIGERLGSGELWLIFGLPAFAFTAAALESVVLELLVFGFGCPLKIVEPKTTNKSSILKIFIKAFINERIYKPRLCSP
jgi:hypothetical protein